MILKIFIGVIVFPLLALNLLAPLIILKKQKLIARAKFQKLDKDEFVSARNENFRKMDGRVRALGFTYMGSSVLSAQETQTYFSIYFNSEDQYVSLLVTCENESVETTYLEFAQLYTDGSMLDVHNSDVVGVYPKMLPKIAALFPAIKEPEVLFAIFRKLSSYWINNGKVVARDAFAGFDTLESYMALESDELVRLKYCTSDIDSDGMRALTVKGAYMLTWRSVFPGKKIQAAINSSLSKKMLREA